MLIRRSPALSLLRAFLTMMATEELDVYHAWIQAEVQLIMPTNPPKPIVDEANYAEL